MSLCSWEVCCTCWFVGFGLKVLRLSQLESRASQSMFVVFMLCLNANTKEKTQIHKKHMQDSRPWIKVWRPTVKTHCHGQSHVSTSLCKPPLTLFTGQLASRGPKSSTKGANSENKRTIFSACSTPILQQVLLMASTTAPWLVRLK